MASRQVAACALGLVGLGLSSCEEYGQRVYSARPYRAEQHCVGASVPIGIVRASELPATCAPRCLSIDAMLYVSVVCAPYPLRAIEVTPRDSPDCASAISLLESNAGCPLPSSFDAGLSDAAAGLSDAAPGDASDPVPRDPRR